MWDTRQPTAAATVNLAERIYAMDAKGGAIVAGTAGKQIAVYNISNLGGQCSVFSPIKCSILFSSISLFSVIFYLMLTYWLDFNLT